MERLFNGLRYTIVENCTVLPLAFSSNSGSIRGGITGANLPEYAHQISGDGAGNHYVKTRFRHGDSSGHFHGFDPVYVPGTTVYLGPLHRHFGHAMTESMARTWITDVKEFENAKFAFLPECISQEDRQSIQSNGVDGFRKEILDFMNLADASMITVKSTFEKLVIPEPGFILFSEKIHPTFIEFLTRNCRNQFNPADPWRKIYYGRPATLGSVAGEKTIENFLQQHNYEYVRPEQLSIREQLKLASETQIVVGVQGSTFHAFNLLGTSKAKAVVIQRQGSRINNGFLKSIRPFFSEVYDCNKSKIVLGMEKTDIVLPDISKLLQLISEADPSVEIEKFPWSDFYAEVRRAFN